MGRLWLLRVSLGSVLAVQLSGCAHLCRAPQGQQGPLASRFAPPGRILVPGPLYTQQPLPQINAPLVPPGPGWRAVPDPRQPGEFQAPGVRTYPPEWRSVPDSQLPTAEPPPADPATPRTRLLPPQFDALPEPPPNRSEPTPPLPVGIPQYTQARERVASGLKPLLDGLDWLKANGYRTVLHLRSPGQDDSAERREVEKRGLKYLSMEVAPPTLSRAVVEEFNRLVADAAQQPLFVFDRDGRLAGSLWYLHFRTAERLGDEPARSKASRLGLREDSDGEQRELWLAIQRVLGEWGNQP